MDAAPRLGHYPEWFLLKTLMPLLQSGEMATACQRARVLARLARRILKKEWAWANANLRLVYGPTPTDEQLARLATLAFENIVLSHLEGIRVGDVRVREVGVDPLHQAWGLGRGMILCSVHLGSWEPMLKHLATMGYPVAAVYRHASNPLSEKVFMDLRRDYGIQWIRRLDVRGVVEALRQRKALCLMVDINTVKGGVLAPFLGAPALCPPGPARLAMQFQMPMVAGVTVREGDGAAALHLIDVMAPPAKGGDDRVVRELTTKINQLFAPWIHQYAEQYNWLHGRWKTGADGRSRSPDQLTRVLWPQRREPFADMSPRVLELLQGSGS